MTPRVLHFLSCDDWGGTEVQVARLIEHGDPSRCIQHIATLAPPGVLTARLAAKGVAVASLSGRVGPIGTIVRLARLIRRWRINVVEVYGFRAGLVARPAVLLGGRPLLIIGVRGPHFVDAPITSKKARFALFVERVLGATVTQYVANSTGAANLLRTHGFDADKLTVIPNGIEVPNTARALLVHHPPRIVCVARFTPSKRHDVLLDALRLLRLSGIAMTCTLVGDGETLAASKRRASALMLGPLVNFMGRVDPERVATELTTADLFVLVSEREGMPGSVLEAMASGLPVIATDVEGTREIVEHDVSGVLIPAGDPKALADAIRSLAGSPRRMASMGAAGHRIVATRFSVDRLTETRAQLYVELLNRRRTRKTAA